MVTSTPSLSRPFETLQKIQRGAVGGGSAGLAGAARRSLLGWTEYPARGVMAAPVQRAAMLAKFCSFGHASLLASPTSRTAHPRATCIAATAASAEVPAPGVQAASEGRTPSRKAPMVPAASRALMARACQCRWRGGRIWQPWQVPRAGAGMSGGKNHRKKRPPQLYFPRQIDASGVPGADGKGLPTQVAWRANLGRSGHRSFTSHAKSMPAASRGNLSRGRPSGPKWQRQGLSLVPLASALDPRPRHWRYRSSAWRASVRSRPASPASASSGASGSAPSGWPAGGGAISR
jgi:hypothetical protein